MENNTENNNDNLKREIKKVAGLLFVGFMFLGIAVGKFYNNPGIGLFAGMGLGFLVAAIYRSEKMKKL